jgi:hypothetical protein
MFLGGYEKMLQTPHRLSNQIYTLLTNGGREGSSLFFEELKNIENRVAWFLEEVSRKAQKGVQKYNDGNRDKKDFFFVLWRIL